MPAAATIELQTVKSWLSFTGNADDDLLQSLIDRTFAAVESYCDRTLLSAASSFTRNGNGKSILSFPNGPVTAVSSVVVNDTAIPSRSSVSGSGYAFDEDFLYLSGYCFTAGVRNVVVGFTSGYETLPKELQDALLETVAHKYRRRDRIGMSSKVMQGETNAFLRDVPPDVIRVLQGYVRVVPSI